MGIAAACALFGLGLFLTIKGGDYFIDASAWIAEAFGIPKVIVGATVVSLATTLPEIIVSVLAALSGRAEIAVGNAVGSVTANTALIFALCAVLSPFALRRREYAVKGVLMVLAIGTLFACSRGGSLGPLGVAALLVIFVVFLVDTLRQARSAQRDSESPRPERRVIARKLLDFLLGTVGIVAGARLLVDNGALLAARLGVPEGVIAVTIIAVGTSLPELVTAIAAIVKKQGALSVGNILGSNIIDTTLIVPLCGLLTGQAMPLSQQSLRIDLPFCLLAALVAVVPMLGSAKTTKGQGFFLLAVYGAYLAALLSMVV